MAEKAPFGPSGQTKSEIFLHNLGFFSVAGPSTPYPTQAKTTS